MTSFVKTIFVKLWKLVLSALGVLRRALCCFRRRRRASDVGLPISVQDGTIISMHAQCQVEDMHSWDTWQDEDEPTSVTVDGQTTTCREAGEPHEEEEDFFRDMAPTVLHQKIYVPPPKRSDGSNDGNSLSSRLRMDTKLLIPQGSELGDLEEPCDGGWETLGDDADLGSALREQRRTILEQRLAQHQQRKTQREQRRAGAQRDKAS